jgi:hypothetical protein
MLNTRTKAVNVSEDLKGNFAKKGTYFVNIFDKGWISKTSFD